MNHDSRETTVVPVGASLHRNVEVRATEMRIRDLSIERPDIVDYLLNISPEKQEVALVHAIEVGITEIMARRGRRGLES